MAPPTAEQLDFVNNYCAKLLFRALTTNFLGIGRDDPLIIRILTSLTRSQAIGVDQFYRTLNTQNQSLPMKLESLGGSYGHFLSALTQSTESFHASLIFSALDGLATDVPLLNEIFCLLPHHELAAAGDAFNRKYGVNLKDRLQAKLSGTKNHLQLLVKLLHNGRTEDQTVDEAGAVEQARTLNTIFAKKSLLGNLTDDATTELIDFVLTLSYSQAQAVKKQFEIQNPTQPSVETLISQRTGGGLQQALHLLLSDPTEVYARKIMEACSGGVDEPIWRIIGGHNVSYVDEIAVVYQKNFSADMRMLIRTKTSGRFQDALVSYLEYCSHPMDHSEEDLLDYLLTLDVFFLTHFPLDHPTLIDTICNRAQQQLYKIDEIFRQKNDRQTLTEYLNNMKGKERRESKRFLKYVVVDGVEVDVRSLRKALNLDQEDGDFSSVNQRAIIETLCAKSPGRLVAARELYERLFDANFLETLQSCLSSDPVLAIIVTALVSHNRQEIMDRADWEDGSPESIVEEIEGILGEPTPDNLQELAMSFLTHSLDQMKLIAQLYESTYHKNLEREITKKIPGLLGIAFISFTLDRAPFLARQIHASISDPDTINRLIGGSDKPLLVEVKKAYESHFRTDLLVDLANAYPTAPEYVAYVTSWITAPGFPSSA